MGYFTVEITPTIAGNLQAAAFGADDLLFDWVSFQVPRGANKLIAATAILRSKNGDHQTAPKLDLYFAKTVSLAAPSTLGVVNSGVTGLPAITNHLIGITNFQAGEFGQNSGESFTIGSTGGGGASSSIPTLVLEGEINSGDNVGYDTLYVGAAAGSAIDFGTTVLARGGEAADVTVVETDKGSDDDPGGQLIFAPGDVLVGATGAALGTVASIAAFASSKQDITFTAGTTEVLDDNEEILCANPIKIILSFER